MNDTQQMTALPETIPIFPLSGIVLFPGCKLPLNIFEPRYIAMCEAALATPHRLIGMVQPKGEGYDTYNVGCAGRIVAFEETSDGRYIVNLLGVSRFNIAEEIDPCDGYRIVRPSWAEFADDIMLLKADHDAPEMQDDVPPITNDQVVKAVSPIVESQSVQADWDALNNLPAHQMIDILAMHLPFSAQDKQALLEARNAQERFDTLKVVSQIHAASQEQADLVQH